MPMGGAPMRTIHILRSGRKYFIDGIFWGEDEEGVMRYLSVTGIALDAITQALAGVALVGGAIIQEEEISEHVLSEILEYSQTGGICPKVFHQCHEPVPIYRALDIIGGY